MRKNHEILDEVMGTLKSTPDLTDSQYHYIKLAMDEYAKEVAIDFFKWYGVRMVAFIEYITKIKPLVESNEMEEKIKEHEGCTFQELFNQYLNSK